ncbi:MAG: hypothetical protein ACI4SM_04380 [Candidatus Gastranaerophilaceae bacterium]
MFNLILISLIICFILAIPTVLWRVKAGKECAKYLSLEEKDLDYLIGKKPIFTKYWMSNSLYKDYIDKTKLILNGNHEYFDFAKWGIALKMDVYPDTIILSNLSGIFLKKRAIVLSKISKINKNKQIVAFKGANFKFIANNFSQEQLEKLNDLKR